MIIFLFFHINSLLHNIKVFKTFTNYSKTMDCDKFTLITKPEQSGKTFIMIQEIIKDLTEGNDELGGKTVINFIFCDNNLLLTKQTAERVHQDLDAFIANGQLYVEFSSRKGNEAKCSSAIYQAICGGQQNIICCTNGRRVKDVKEIIMALNSSPFLGDKFAFKIWLDEADKFPNFISNTFIPLVAECENTHVYCITATSSALFKKYKTMNVFPLEETTKENYHGWKDNEIVVLDALFENTETFVYEVLSQYPENIQPGTKWYIPAERKKSSHYMVKSICLARGMAVFVINGDGLTLERPGMEAVIENKTDELNKHIMKLYREHNLSEYAVAVTGNICVGRGISIMSPDFIFDYGILYSCVKKAEVSQTAGRLKGNIKNWPNYKPPIVFTSHNFDTIATEWEEKSRRLAILAYEQQDSGETTVITEEQYKKIGGNNHEEKTKAEDTDKEHCVFETQDEAREFGKTLGVKLNKRKAPIAPKELQKDGRNPTSDELFKRMWGISAKNTVRMIPTSNGKWCVYWRPSLIKHD